LIMPPDRNGMMRFPWVTASYETALFMITSLCALLI
jgi:hypothetical protein